MTEQQAEFIRIIAEGGTWDKATKELRVSSATLSKWLREDADLEKQYAHAREAQGDAYADRVIDVAEDPTLDPAEKRVRMDAYKWAAGKRKPKVYGDRVTQDVNHSGSLEVSTKEQRDASVAAALRADA